jgi:hypothetical protein
VIDLLSKWERYSLLARVWHELGDVIASDLYGTLARCARDKWLASTEEGSGWLS